MSEIGDDDSENELSDYADEEMSESEDEQQDQYIPILIEKYRLEWTKFRKEQVPQESSHIIIFLDFARTLFFSDLPVYNDGKQISN